MTAETTPVWNFPDFPYKFPVTDDSHLVTGYWQRLSQSKLTCVDVSSVPGEIHSVTYTSASVSMCIRNSFKFRVQLQNKRWVGSRRTDSQILFEGPMQDFFKKSLSRSYTCPGSVYRFDGTRPATCVAMYP